MARITSVQKQLKGPINRDENLIAHSWYIVLLVGAIIGAVALLVWMFQIGAWSERRGSMVNQTPVVIEQQASPVPEYPSKEVGQRPASLEEKTNQFWDRTLRRD